MPLERDLTEFAVLVHAGAAALRNVVNEPELSAWLEGIAAERLGPAGLAPEGAEPTRESKAREWLAKVVRKHQLREGVSETVGPSAASNSSSSSWSGLAWVQKALDEQRVLSCLLLTHEEREKIGGVLDWMRSIDGPQVAGDWTRISFDQALKAEHDWIEAKAKAFAKKEQDEAADLGTTLFVDLSSLEGKWAEWMGWRWVRVASAEALDREGALMRHCVGSYAKDVASGRKTIYSLRDPENKPKLTVEAQGLTLSQLKGYANGACPAELREAAGAFAQAFEKGADPAGLGLVELSSDMERAGFAALPGVGVFQKESGFSPEQRARWEKRLSDLAKKSKGKAKDVECEELVRSLARMGMAQELGALLPLVDPLVKHLKALLGAASGGHKAIVEMLLPWSDPKAKDSEALREAAESGHKEIVEMLLPVSDAKARDSEALCEAARGGHKEIVEMLLPGSDPMAKDSAALRCAAVGGHKEIVEMLLPVSDAGAQDSAALREAAGVGYNAVVEILLPVSDARAWDSEALREAARGGHKEIVEMLLPWSDPKAKDSEALREAAERGHKEIVEMLLPVSDAKARDSEALREAAKRGRKEIVEMLLPGSNARARDSAALREAARRGHKEVVEILLPGSDPKAGDSAALRGAANGGHKEIVEMLLPGSDPKALDSEALRGAAERGHKEVVEMLLPVADPKALDSAALRVAASIGHKEIVEMLLPVSDARARDSGALREAASVGHKEIVQMIAPYYLGDEETFHRLLKESGMDSKKFHFSTVAAAGNVEPISASMVDKVVGRRQKNLSQELVRARPGRPLGA